MKYIKLFEDYEWLDYDEDEQEKRKETEYILDLFSDIIDKYNLSRGSHDESRLGNVMDIGSHYTIQYLSDEEDKISIDTYCDTINTSEYKTDMYNFVSKLEDLGYSVEVRLHNEIQINPYLKDINPGVVYDLEIEFT